MATSGQISRPPLGSFYWPLTHDSAIRLEALPDDFEAELLQASERGQVRASEGSVGHVEVFPMGGMRTSIIGRPRPLPRDRRADHHYTLDCEEPSNCRCVSLSIGESGGTLGRQTYSAGQCTAPAPAGLSSLIPVGYRCRDLGGDC